MLLGKLQTLQKRAVRIIRGVKFEAADNNQLLRSLWGSKASCSLLIMIQLPSRIKSEMELYLSIQNLFLTNAPIFIHTIQN